MFTASLWVSLARPNITEKQFAAISFVDHPEICRTLCSSIGTTASASKPGFEVSPLACCDTLAIADACRLALTIEKLPGSDKFRHLDPVLHGLHMHNKAALAMS